MYLVWNSFDPHRLGLAPIHPGSKLDELTVVSACPNADTPHQFKKSRNGSRDSRTAPYSGPLQRTKSVTTFVVSQSRTRCYTTVAANCCDVALKLKLSAEVHNLGGCPRTVPPGTRR